MHRAHTSTTSQIESTIKRVRLFFVSMSMMLQQMVTALNCVLIIQLYFSNRTRYSERYSPLPSWLSLKNKRASRSSFKHVFLFVTASGVFSGCSEGYQITCPSFFTSSCGVVHCCDASPAPRSLAVLKEI